MLARFVGTHIHKDCLKAGIAFYPSESDKSYAVQHVLQPVIPETGIPEGLEGEDLQAWLASLDKIRVTNPTFTHFIKVDPDWSKTQLEQEIQRIFTPDVLKSADAFLSDRSATKRQNFSRYRKMMAAKERLGNGLILPKGYKAKGIITAANNKFKGLGDELDTRGKILDIKPGTIHIGAAADDRGADLGSYTLVGKEGAADGDGQITSAWVWLASNTTPSNLEIATFIDQGSNVLSTRDWETWTTPAAGSQQTVSGLTIDVETGDYFGCNVYHSGMAIERDTSGDGYWVIYLTDAIPCTDQAFSFTADRTISLYGEGAAAGNTYEISCSDGIKAGDAPKANLTIDISVSDGIKGGDAPGSQAEMNPTITDGLKLGDTLSTLLEAYDSLTDGVKLGDTLSGGLSITIQVADGLKAGDTPTVFITVPASITDGIKAGDSASTQASLSDTITDGAKFGDTPATQAILQSLLSDGIKVGDTPTVFLTVPISASDGVKLGDALSSLMEFNPSVTDGVKLGDALSSLLEAYDTVSDGVKLGDSPSTQGIFQIQLSDGIKLGEAIAASLSIYTSLTDGVKVGDAPSVTLAIYPVVSDGVKMGDTLVVNIKGRVLTVRVITSHYRGVNVITAKAKLVKAITTF